MPKQDGYGRASDPLEVLAAFSKQRIANAGVNGILQSHIRSIEISVPEDYRADVRYFMQDVWIMLAGGQLVLALPTHYEVKNGITS